MLRELNTANGKSLLPPPHPLGFGDFNLLCRHLTPFCKALEWYREIVDCRHLNIGCNDTPGPRDWSAEKLYLDAG